ncbi:MAG: multidrug ABC transporter ATP-binding protein [Sulfobacillus thermosulfidooxidans]|uniref:Multidrug ABC transporter ATP-binding protein n=1 Tax=Sulfobacillus thermotolerans TaxID=338644 RepID=A0ABM6RRJ4_9FIRM|nr:multidrug ABC transporter ATP-binding protein [Sulfobacillus thermotolerans]MCY0907661.1 ABC transporter ATP-binding protein [Sulfobacillus thermotolerans]PSR37252.1 MAG: multidrug ABC transporter ATP-binding protein [Sulfobacillus thermosulfidooxidans]
MRRILRFLRPYRQSVIWILVLLFLQSLTTLYLPELMSKIVDNGVVKGNIPYIIHVGEFMMAVTVFSVVCSVAAGLLSSKASAGFGKIVRRKVFAHVETFMLKEFDTLGTSSLIVRTTNDIMQVQQFVNMLLRMMVMAPLMALGGIIMAIYTDARLSLILLVIMPVLGLAIYAVLGRSVGLFRAMQGKVDQLNRVLREHLTGVRVIRSFQRVRYEVHRFNEANIELTDISIHVYQIMAALMPLLMLIINFSTLAIIWFGGKLINDNAMQVGSLMAFIQYVTQIMFSVMMVSAMFFMVPRAQASARRINEVLDIEPTILDPAVPTLPTQSTGEVVFEDVSFQYPGAESMVLSHISFTLHPGQITAVIGGTGAGKTTLINLIPRFDDVTHGRVLVDGIDVRDMDQHVLRQKIGFVPQKAVLFSGTIADNIRYGDEDASDWAVEHAADVAQATEFIAEMPQGFDTIISQGGADLSGGQKQRLSIARALVRKPEIYIFDDSFSALDFKTDAKLRRALQNELDTSTVLIVAQRVSTVIDADQIIVLDEGQLVGIGTHRELMATCPIYQDIVRSQHAEEVIA